MPHRRLLVLFTLLSTGAHAQWLNYPTPGTPRTRDGKPNLAAPAPRAANGKPNLSGVWQVQPTSLAEWKVLLGDRFDAQFKGRSLGMELDHISQVLHQHPDGPQTRRSADAARGRGNSTAARAGRPGAVNDLLNQFLKKDKKKD
jgi:hypothetical protein